MEKWYNLSAEETLKKVNSDRKGLSTEEAQKRLSSGEKNVIENKKKQSAIALFLSQFIDLMTLLLIGAAAVSGAIAAITKDSGDLVDTFIIVFIIFLNAIVGFIQQYKADKAIEKLRKMSEVEAKTYRDGRLVTIASSQLTVGDVIELSAGDVVPADCRILDAENFACDESSLTGENHAAVKTRATLYGTKPLGDRKNMCYSSSFVARGRAVCVVVEVGKNSEIGVIAQSISAEKPPMSPLEKSLDVLGRVISISVIAVAILVFICSVIDGQTGLLASFMSAVAIAVAAIPEGLPAVVTIALALAVSRMVKRGALIRKLHAVETMGCAQVICTDKTGTLTENRMTVREIATPKYCFYRADGEKKEKGFLAKNGMAAADSEDIRRMIEIAVLCNNAQLPQERDKKSLFHPQKTEHAQGDPTEISLLEMAETAHFSTGKISREFSRIFEIPFDSQRKRMSVAVRNRQGDRWLFSKGAPDYLLELCSHYLEDGQIRLLTPSVRKKIQAQNEKMAHKALRVLGFAYKAEPEEPEQAESDLIFVGLAGMIDPPRREAYQAVQTCKQAGIQTVMITGDHVDTASAIARDLKILDANGRVLTGRELDRMTDDQLERELDQIRVFARVAPAHKLRIVKAFKRKGRVVAMTGDGVNDAPAIKEADIGVAMGNGTDVTKEAASVVLLDNSFATLVSAIEEGRVIYKNIRKFIRYLLSCNIGEIVTMFFGMLMGMPVVLLPIQILIVNLVTDGLPAIALGLEPAEKDIMRKPPRKKKEGIFSDGLLSTIVFRGALIGLTTLSVFTSFYHSTQNLVVARTGALATLVITQLIHVFECKREDVGIFKMNLLNNWKLVAAVAFSAFILVLSIYLPICNLLFQTAPLSGSQMVEIAVYCAAVPILSSVVIPFKHQRRKQKEREKFSFPFPASEQ